MYVYFFSLNEPPFSSTFLPTIAAIIRTYVNPLKVKRLLEDQKHRLCTNLLMVFVYVHISIFRKYIIIIFLILLGIYTKMVRCSNHLG